MRKNSSIDQLAEATVRQAQSQMAAMQRDLNRLRDSISGLGRSIKAPVPTGGSRTIKGSRTSPSLLDDLGDFAAVNLLDEVGLSGGGASFYTSASQSAGGAMAALNLAQRIR